MQSTLAGPPSWNFVSNIPYSPSVEAFEGEALERGTGLVLDPDQIAYDEGCMAAVWCVPIDSQRPSYGGFSEPLLSPTRSRSRCCVVCTCQAESGSGL